MLVLILMSWTSIDSFPPMVFRLTFGAAVVIPGIMNKNGLLPAALTCFWALTANGYAYSYMPTSEYLYAAIMIIATLFYGRHNDRLKIPSYNVWIVFFLYVLIINIVMQQSVAKLSYTMLVLLLFPYFMEKDLKSVINFFSIAFMVVSIIISYYAITMKDSILMSQFNVQDRIAWVDPNYMGMQVGMGALVGLMNLLKYSKIDIIQKILSPLALVSSLPTILMTGSRGAALCIIGGVFILILSNKTRFIYKALVGLLLSFFVVYLLSEGYFDLLLNRVANDDGTGAGRTEIWLKKLDAFFGLNPVFWLLGCGSTWGVNLGFNRIQGFHNDFIAILCMYGIIGLSLFLYLLFAPLKHMYKKSNAKFEIYACVFYSILAFLTLEPIQSGVIAFYAFMFYTLLKAKYSWYNEK